MVRTYFLAALLPLGLLSCAGAADSTKAEDAARRAVPVPVCIKPLPRHGKENVAPSLTGDDYWSIVLPSYDKGARSVDRGASDCTGRLVFNSPLLNDADGPRTGAIRTGENDVLIGQAPDGFKIVWLRTHKFPDTTAAGPLALLRAKEGYAEVYAVGLHRGRAEKSRFGLEHIGSDLVVAATDDGCTESKPTASCETTMTAYIVNGGQLHRGAQFWLDRAQSIAGSSLGVGGSVQVRLTATPTFEDKGIRLLEQVTVKDAAQRELRKSEVDRLFVRKDRTKLVSKTESIWQQFVEGSGATNR